MKKVIAAFDGLKYSNSTAQYAIDICRSSNDHLVGVFLEDITYHSFKIYELGDADQSLHQRIRTMDEGDKRIRKEAVDHFEKLCQDAGLNYSIHHDRYIALHELLHESIYADLLIVCITETLTNHDEEPPTRFIKDILAEAKCPILVVPKKVYPIEHLALLYDGTPVSVFAIKMFSYVLKSLKYVDVEVLSVKEYDDNHHLDEHRLFKELMKRHFCNVKYVVLNGNPEQEIVKRIVTKGTNTLVVLGAYQRGVMSRWLKMSMADILMKDIEVPLFIAHN